MKIKIYLGIIIIIIVTACPYLSNNQDDSSNDKSNYKYNYKKNTISFFDADGDLLTKSLYDSWKSSYVKSSGASGYLRVVDYDKSEATVSEGMGYGMILAVYFNDKDTFDNLWNYTKLYLNENGLMKWLVNSAGIPQDNGAATDADEDIALALIFADKIWGGYKNDALSMLEAILTYETEFDGLLKPGDSWIPPYPYNPSYFAPAWYKVFRNFTQDNRWDKVITRNYEFIENAQAASGLFPDWCDASGEAFPSKSYDYSYDACRVPWRISIDYIWFNDSRAENILIKMNNFIEDKGPGNLLSVYKLDGTPIENYLDSAFAGPFACSTVYPDLEYKLQIKMYDKFKSSSAINYFNMTVKTLCSLVISGNFPCLLYDEIPILSTEIPPYVTEETELFGKIYGTGPGVDQTADILKRPLPIVWDTDYDISYHDDIEGVQTLTILFDDTQNVNSLILDNLNESNLPSKWNRLYCLRVLAILSDRTAEYIYDNNGLSAIGYGHNIYIPFIKPVNARALRIELTDSRYRCHVRLMGINKVDFPPEISNISHTSSGNTYYLSINYTDPDDLPTTSVIEKNSSSVLINKTDEKNYNFNLTEPGNYTFEIKITDGTNEIIQEYTINVI